MNMLRTAVQKVVSRATRLIVPAVPKRTVYHTALNAETPDELDSRYECFFYRPDIDGWDIRQAMNDLAGMDLVPDPRIIIAALYACRRVNDYALAIRFLETVKWKCGKRLQTIWPYILQEIGPTLCDLGIDTPEGLGYDKPELWSDSV